MTEAIKVKKKSSSKKSLSAKSKLIKLKEDKISSHYTDDLNDLGKFKEKLAENYIRVERQGDIVQLIHASGVSVSLEYRRDQDISYYNYMLQKLLNKIKE